MGAIGYTVWSQSDRAYVERLAPTYQMPAISIIVPSYNHAAYLSACIESIRAQTLVDWELIIIDDRSSDASAELARSLASGDSRIRVFENEENLGTYGTEQRAVERAKAPYVAIMNSDDVWAPTKLERQIAKLEADFGASFCYVFGATVNEEGKQLDDLVTPGWPQSDPQEPLPYLLTSNRILASGVVFRRKSIRFHSTCRYSGDWVALLEQSLLGHARCVAEPLVYWRQHATNSYRRSIPQTFEEIRVRQAIHDSHDIWFVRGIPPRKISQGLALNAMHLVPLLVYVNALELARKYAWYAVRNYADKPVALKRTLGLYLGLDRARSHFWSAADLAIAKEREGEFKKLLQTLPPLNFSNPGTDGSGAKPIVGAG